MERKDFLVHERRKAVIRALAELEIAANTFSDFDQLVEFNKIREQLKQFKADHLD